jgi:ribosome biogenesis GTPase
MITISDQIIKLGFDHRFQKIATPEKLAGFSLGRIISVHKDSYTVNNGEKNVLAELVGKLMYGATSPMDYPTVGDWVYANFYDDDSFSIIHEVLPRQSLLKRKTPGKKIDFQLIAANIDTAFVVQSLDDNFNPRRLERYLAMCNEGHIQPVVLLSKSDLVPPQVVENKVGELKKQMPHLPVHPFSNKNHPDTAPIKRLLLPGQTYCLLGSSGVGKTTLINRLMGEPTFFTKPVREKDGKGKHATTRRQLIQLDGGAMVIDTPGMRELGNFDIRTGLAETFPEIIDLSAKCRFNDCTHVNEKGCAVIEAVTEGLLPVKRYENYLKMNKEALYNEMSYLEKRQKDRQFGKYCKSIMKHKKYRK